MLKDRIRIISGFGDGPYYTKYTLDSADWPEFKKTAENNGWVFKESGRFFIGTKPWGTVKKADQPIDEAKILEALQADPSNETEIDWPSIP